MKSGTPGAKSGAEADAEIGAVAVVGKVHATSVVAKTYRLFWEADEATVAGSDWWSAGAGITQQSIWAQSPHAQLDLAGKKEKDVGADAIA